MPKLIFVTSKGGERVMSSLGKEKKRRSLNFLNNHDLYWFNKEPQFRKSLLEKQNINFIDGFLVSLFLGLRYLRAVNRFRGPVFTKLFLSNPEYSGGKKHLFIGLEKEDLERMSKKFPHLSRQNIWSYNPPFINGIEFSEGEIDKMVGLIRSKKIDYVWVGVGCPKQNILTSALFKRTGRASFLNVGAALDFFLEKKKEQSGLIQAIGLEWVYRLATDFKHSRKKVWRSFIGLLSLSEAGLAR